MDGLEQEVSNRFGLTLQDLFDQINPQYNDDSSESLDESMEIVLPFMKGSKLASRQSSLRYGPPMQRCLPLRGLSP